MLLANKKLHQYDKELKKLFMSVISFRFLPQFHRQQNPYLTL